MPKQENYITTFARTCKKLLQMYLYNIDQIIGIYIRIKVFLLDNFQLMLKLFVITIYFNIFLPKLQNVSRPLFWSGIFL